MLDNAKRTYALAELHSRRQSRQMAFLEVGQVWRQRRTPRPLQQHCQRHAYDRPATEEGHHYARCRSPASGVAP